MTTQEQFKRDVAEHVMEVFQDNGVHRHLRFRKPGTMCMHFDLITWPGYLCYTGDMGTYVFRRLEDMFTFFRLDASYANKPTPGGVLDRISRGYWAEKLEATDKGGGHKEFDADKFRRVITTQRRKLLLKHTRKWDSDDRQSLWDDLDSVLDASYDGESRAIAAVMDWSFHYSNEVLHLDIYEFPDCKTYTHCFLWCCYALRWGIHLYDQSKPK